MSKRNKNIGAFMLSFGICTAIAGVVLMILGSGEGIFTILAGAFVSTRSRVNKKV